MQYIKQISYVPFLFTVILGLFLFGILTKADTQDEIIERQKQIEEIQRQIEQYQAQIDSTRIKSKTLENEISKLNAQINQLQLEIQSLDLSINQTGTEINETQNKISDAEGKLKTHKEALGQYIKLAYESDQKTLTEILLKHNNLSDFFGELNSVKTTQDKLRATIINIKSLKANLQEQHESLEEKQSELERLKRLQELEKSNLDRNKNGKNKILKETKGQESKFQELVKKSQKDIEAIRSEITYLQQNGVTAEEAVKYGQLAAIHTGIRPAFLIAILEIESGLGKNVGTGNWMDDMYKCYLRLGKPSRAETEKHAFLALVGELGLDPNNVKVSREPNYGCGGALGPAQFLPSTWLGYKADVAAATGHNPPSPWNIEDAFMASAIKLARAGADTKTKVGEIRAAKTYISGKPTCTSRICSYYANAVLRKAAEIEPNL